MRYKETNVSTETVKTDRKIEFNRFTASDIDMYMRRFPDGFERGCEFSFANLFLWGRQRFAEIDGQIVLFSQFDRRSVYPFPVGDGEGHIVQGYDTGISLCYIL